MTKPTKSEISQEFKQLEKYGYKVFTFNSNKRVRTTGFVDHVIVGKGKAYFIEVKIGKDVMSELQKKTARYFETLFTYHIATENNYKEIIDSILWNGSNA